MLLVSYRPLVINSPAHFYAGVVLASPAALGANATQECVFFVARLKNQKLWRAVP